MARTSAGTWLFRPGVGVIAILLLAPVLVVIPLSFTSQPSFIFPPNGYSTRWYEKFFTDPQWVSAFWDSVWIATATSVLATVIGTAACFGMKRLGPRAKLFCIGVLLLPVVVPIVITGVRPGEKLYEE